jgi:phosphate transport system permease protein
VPKASVARERLAFGVIRLLSLLTIAILGLIMGFILYKGLRYSNETRSSVLPQAEAAPEGLSLVVNDGIDLKSIDFDTLYGMYTDEYINWSKISADEPELVPIALDTAGAEGQATERLLFGEGGLKAAGAEWGSLVRFSPDTRAELELVRSTPGAAALVPASELEAGGTGAGARGGTSALKGLRVVPIRRLTLAVNEEVMALIDNSSISDLSDEAIDRLMKGRIANWKELGGPDLEVAIVDPGLGQADRAEAIAARSGAVGYLDAAEAKARGISTLTRKGRESGWNLTLGYLFEAPRLSGKVGGISTIILNTFFMLLLTTLMAAPIGVAAAVYLVEYAKQGPIVRILRLGTETLAGIPSIIFGLFGFLFFVDILGLGFGLLSGCLTLTLMILPTIVRTSEEAIKAVPHSLREGSLALGATKLQTIVRVVIPAAASGIVTGLILGLGRAVGETAALIFTMGSDYKLAKGLFSSARVLSSHVYLLFAEGISFDRAFSTATVLILIVLAFNFAARRLVAGMGGAKQ